MRLVRDLRFFHRKQFKDLAANCVVGVTVGNFDGVHLGHQALFQELSSAVARNGERALKVIISFEPHPKRYFRGISRRTLSQHMELWPICPLREKVLQAASFGFDIFYLARFNKQLAEQSPEMFVKLCLVEALAAKIVVVGHDWAFGKGRQGDPELLLRLGEVHGFDVKIVPPVEIGGFRVSSTAVREALRSGDVKLAKVLLGRNYSFTATVCHGDKRGQQLGFPTANQTPRNVVVPRPGVYATRSLVNNKLFTSVTNVGYRPTFGGNTLVVETHLIEGESFNLYGRRLSVEFVERIRDEQKFASIEELRAQIQRDIVTCRILTQNSA